MFTQRLWLGSVNLESEQLSQGHVGVVHDVPTGDSVTLYVPDSRSGEATITPEMLQREEYLTWRTDFDQANRVRASFQEKLRRTNADPFMNVVALTTHKVMGDTFDKLPTSISATDNSYALWMTSQNFVIVSRVKQLKN